MNKLEEFKAQLIEANRKIIELEELKEDLHFRIDEEEEKLETTKLEPIQNGMYLSNEQLHKLFSLLDNTITPNQGLDGKSKRNLFNFKEELSYQIGEHFGYDINEGTVDPSDFKFKQFGETD